jgi:hypothetical protein
VAARWRHAIYKTGISLSYNLSIRSVYTVDASESHYDSFTEGMVAVEIAGRSISKWSVANCPVIVLRHDVNGAEN